MSREIKHVPMDFDWPIGETWRGYLNPHYEKCRACKGSGETMARHRLSDLVGLLMLSGEDAKQGKCHPYFKASGLYRSRGAVCDDDMAELTTALAGREPGVLGHDAVDNWKATCKITEAAGLPDTWGTCPDCDGHGIARERYAAYEAWESYEPPLGDGWQMWETTSEGSAISPVCESPEALAHWLADNGASANGSQTATYDQWLAMINAGWAPSMIATPHGLKSGVVGIGR